MVRPAPTRDAVRVFLFDADGNDTELNPQGGLTLPGERQLLWVVLEGTDVPHLAELLAPLNLHPVTLRQLAEQPQGRPRLVHHGHYVALNVSSVVAETQALVPLLVVAGQNFVVTAHPQPIAALDEFMGQMQGDTQLGQLDSAGFLGAVLMRLLESYFTATARLEEATDRLDEVLLQRIPEEEPLNELVQLRRQVGVLRRELSAHRPVFLHLASPDFVVYAGDQREGQFMMLLNQFDHALDSVAQSRDLVLGSFDLYMTSLGRRTNDIMRVLTVVTLALGVSAAVAGLMGMNFEADIFKSGNEGFRDVLIGSGVLIVLVVFWGRWRKWL